MEADPDATTAATGLLDTLRAIESLLLEMAVEAEAVPPRLAECLRLTYQAQAAISFPPAPPPSRPGPPLPPPVTL